MEKAVTAVSLRRPYSQEVWKNRIASCRGSGQGVRAWCAENAICVSTYYRWERQLLTKAGSGRGTTEIGRFAELPIAEAPDASAVVAVLHAAGVECEIRGGISEKLLRALVRSMNDHA